MNERTDECAKTMIPTDSDFGFVGWPTGSIYYSEINAEKRNEGIENETNLFVNITGILEKKPLKIF